MKRLLLLVLVLAIVLAVWVSGARPVVSLERPLKAIGLATTVRVKVSGKNGVRYFRAELEQEGVRFAALEQWSGVSRWAFWRARPSEQGYQFVAGRRTMPQLKDGPARLVLEAKSDDWRGATATMTVDLAVRSYPPRLTADGAQHYINQGGSEMVVMTVEGDAIEAGVRVGPHRFRSWPLPGGPPGSRFSIFAFPYYVPADSAPLVYARDEADNEAVAPFWFRVFPRQFRARDIELTGAFMQKVTAGILPRTPQIVPTGDLLKDFLTINGELRRQNNRQLSDLRLKTEGRFLWSRPFRQLANTQVEAQFADHRRYLYRGAKVAEQDHLGFDLAATANVPVVAANDGKVVFADFLGIYGNCVVIDHGYALQSIYGHLNTIGVKAGDAVKQGQEIGRSGSTGLAGGDHLHFSMQVDGVQVNPTEWWDEHWIHDRVLLKFPDKKLPGT